MEWKKKKVSPWLILIGAILSMIAGYFIAASYEKGMTIIDFVKAFSYVWHHPSIHYFNENTFKVVVVTEMFYGVAMLMYSLSLRNLMPGKEYGTARFAPPKMVNKQIADDNEYRNRILSQNIRMSLDFRKIKLNGNILICGGSGAGKTFYEVKPNLMQMPDGCSFVITDPKAEILRSCGDMLKKNGYRVKVLNLIEMDKSDCYNPFAYIREETDIIKLITNLIANTTPKGAAPSDPFWEKAESMFLTSIMYYVWLVMPKNEQNFSSVLKLISEAEVSDKNKPSKLDIRMKYIEETNPLGARHPAVMQYNKCMRGAGDTVRSIIISANSRLAYLENKQVLRVSSRDEMNFGEIGVGVNGDQTTKTALFCVIPDSDKSYNFIVGMLYTQLMQELYYQADFNCGGRLPIHVSFMLDEFANVALPEDFCSILSTCRSRELSMIMIIQNMAQLKAMYKDTWETVPGNADTFIYLGGNEQSTHKYVSELLGKATIDKRSTGETRGRQGSASRNYDVLGRELYMPDEVRKLDNKKCMIFIRGFDPIIDYKYVPFKHKAFSQTEDGGARAYIHQVNKDERKAVPRFELIGEHSIAFFERLKEQGEKVYIDSLTYGEFMLLGDKQMQVRITKLDEEQQKRKHDIETENELEYMPDDFEKALEKQRQEEKRKEEQEEQEISGKRKELTVDNITNRMLLWDFTIEQKEELTKALKDHLPKDKILKFFYPETTAEEMRQQREELIKNV